MAAPNILIGIEGTNNEYKQEYHFDIGGTQFELMDCFEEFKFIINSQPLDKLFLEEIEPLENDAFDVNGRIIKNGSTYYLLQSYHLAIKLFEFEFDLGFKRIDEGDISFLLPEKEFFINFSENSRLVYQFMFDNKLNYEQAIYREFKEYFLIKHTKGFTNYIYLSPYMDYYRRMPFYKRAVIVFFYFKYKILFLPILLVEEIITAIKLTDIYAKIDSKIAEKTGESPMNTEELFIDTIKALKFVDCFINQNIIDEIQRGENINVEFKESIWFNSYTGRLEKEPNSTFLKTIAGFLNTDGGKIFVGIKDDKTIIGIEKDDFHDEDSYMLRLINIFNTRLAGHNINSVNLNIENIKGQKVCIINCKRQMNPVYLINSGKEEFYVRTGPSTRLLQPREMINYLKNNGKY